MEAVEKKILGRKDLVSFPDFELENVPVKIDSGAYSSSMHCQSIEVVEFDEKEQLRVVFLDSGISGYTGKEVVFDDFKTKTAATPTTTWASPPARRSSSPAPAN